MSFKKPISIIIKNKHNSFAKKKKKKMIKENNIMTETNEIKKEPCFKCVVGNLPGGKMNGIYYQCSDCMSDFQKKQLKE
jgi:hypothetical protein